MGFGLCLGGLGIGKCGNTSSKQSASITNSAIASAYYKNAFSCKRKVDSGNTVKADGYCSCGELGIGNSIDCRKYKQHMAILQAQTCNNVLKNRPDLPPEMVTCICHSGGAGCNLDVSQTSTVTTQFTCTNKNDVKQNLSDNFTNDVLSNMKQNMSDVGGLFDSNDQSVVANLATKIRQNISDEMIQDISSDVTASNNVEAGCGGLNFGITQYSQFTSIIKVLGSNQAIATAMNELQNHMKATVERKDSGFLGWLTSSTGIIVMIIIGIAVIVGLVLLFKYKPWEKK